VRLNLLPESTAEMKIRRILLKMVCICLMSSWVVAAGKEQVPVISYDAFCKSSLILAVPFSKVKSFFQAENPRLDFFKDKAEYPFVLKLPNLSVDDDAVISSENAFSAPGIETMGGDINCVVYLVKNGKSSFRVLRIGSLAEDSQDLVHVFLDKEAKSGQVFNKKKKAYKVIAGFLEKASLYVRGGSEGIYWDGGPAQILEASYMHEVIRSRKNFSLKDFEDIVGPSKCNSDDLITNSFEDNHGGITLELVRQSDGSIVFREWGPFRPENGSWGIGLRSEEYLKGKVGSNSKPVQPKADELNCWGN
jgi:hypothetical protein